MSRYISAKKRRRVQKEEEEEDELDMELKVSSLLSLAMRDVESAQDDLDGSYQVIEWIYFKCYKSLQRAFMALLTHMKKNKEIIENFSEDCTDVRKLCTLTGNHELTNKMSNIYRLLYSSYSNVLDESFNASELKKKVKIENKEENDYDAEKVHKVCLSIVSSIKEIINQT